jgi:hypothetical protein
MRKKKKNQLPNSTAGKVTTQCSETREKKVRFVRTYVRRLLKTSNKSETVCDGALQELLGQPGEKYVDYFVFNIIDCGLPRSGARHGALAQTIGNARGSTSTRPGVRKFMLKTCSVPYPLTMLPSGLAHLRTYFFKTPMNLSKGNILCRNTGPRMEISSTR